MQPNANTALELLSANNVNRQKDNGTTVCLIHLIPVSYERHDATDVMAHIIWQVSDDAD